MRYGKGTIGARLAHLTAQFKEYGADSPARDAQLILAAFLDQDPSRLRLMLDDEIPADYTSFGAGCYYTDQINAYKSGMPISKVIGKRAFWKEDFFVNTDVLDPRPETERLIEVALQTPFERVLDLGTGSGCILISLLKEMRMATGVGVDISARALKVAGKNSADAGTTKVAEWRKSDWFEQVEGTFDLIVSNPPYIAADEMAGLDANVRDFDPEIALTDGADGLSCYRTICTGVMAHLAKEGRLIVEIGPTQAVAVSQMFRDAGLRDVHVFQDLDGRDRVIWGISG